MLCSNAFGSIKPIYAHINRLIVNNLKITNQNNLTDRIYKLVLRVYLTHNSDLLTAQHYDLYISDRYVLVI